MKYGRLSVVGKEGKTREKHKCLCDCGNVVYVKLNALRSGNTKSCGCLHSETVSDMFKKHGMVSSPEYNSWQLMKDRCYNVNNKVFHYYGGKGISVCDRWLESFDDFLLDMGNKPHPSCSIDRIDSDGDYSPSNCRWATKTEQVRNRKNTKLIEFNNEIKPLAEWCEIFGLDYSKTYKRLWRGSSVERAFRR